MIGERYYDNCYGWGTVVAEVEDAFMVEYDNIPEYYGIYEK